MTEDEVYENLPEDPGLAFVALERHFRQKYEEATKDEQEGGVYKFYQVTYLNEVIAAAKQLEIPGIRDYELPEDENHIWDFYRLVLRDVELLIVQIRIANSSNVRRYSVVLNPAEKEKARHFIDQLCKLVDNSNCSQEKKEAIKKKLSELRYEFEQDRTRFDRFADGMRSIAKLSSDFEKEGAEPWWKWVRALFGIIDDAKENEPKPSLPPPKETKRLEAPRKQIPNFNGRTKLDDEVPF